MGKRKWPLRVFSAWSVQIRLVRVFRGEYTVKKVRGTVLVQLNTIPGWRIFLYLKIDTLINLLHILVQLGRGFTIAGHRHQGWCRHHRHSGILHISPVPDWVPLFRYRTGSGDTRLTECCTVLHFGIYKNCRLVERHTPCTSILVVGGGKIRTITTG